MWVDLLQTNRWGTVQVGLRSVRIQITSWRNVVDVGKSQREVGCREESEGEVQRKQFQIPEILKESKYVLQSTLHMLHHITKWKFEIALGTHFSGRSCSLQGAPFGIWPCLVSHGAKGQNNSSVC